MRPTIAELEAILEEKDVKIEILPSGEVQVSSPHMERIDALQAQLAEANAQAEDAVNLLHRSHEREVQAKHEVDLLRAELDSMRLRLKHMEEHGNRSA